MSKYILIISHNDLGEYIMIIAETSYTKESYKKYVRFYITKIAKKKKILRILYQSILLVLGLIVIISFSLEKNMDAPVYFGIASVIFAIGDIIHFLCLPNVYANSMVKKNPILFETKITFSFYTDYFDVASTTDLVCSKSDIKYEALLIVYEVNDYFYMYMPNKQAYIVYKNDIMQGTTLDLSELLSRTLHKKYVRCN